MSVVVSGVAAVTPVGLYAAASCAAFRGNLSGTKELFTHHVMGELLDREPMVGGRVPTEWLSGEPEEERWPGHERFDVGVPAPKDAKVPPGIERVLELCRIAATEVRHSAALDEVKTDRYRVYMATSELDPVGDVLAELCDVFGGSPSRFVVQNEGRAGGLGLLELALEDLAAHRCEGVLLGGVDSLIRRPVAEHYDHQRRLRSYIDPQGLLPGEGAGFVYLESAERALHRHRTVFAEVRAAATALEPSVASGEPNRAVGLSEALRRARTEAGLDRMPMIVCDLNGERPRALEWTVGATRALGDLDGEIDLWHPAECTGDMGAAAGVVDLVWAATALEQGYAPEPRALVWGASDGALRAAAVLAAPSTA